jgi:dihydrofolate reductase
MLLGRVLYKGFEQAWPAMAESPDSPQEIVDFAHWVEDTPKIVFSSTLDKTDWKSSQLIHVTNDEDIAQNVAELKQQGGKDMVVFGGAQFAQTLVKHGLVDEYQFKIQPIALGKGKALFGGLADRANLKLVDSKSFDSGVITACYQPLLKP